MVSEKVVGGKNVSDNTSATSVIVGDTIVVGVKIGGAMVRGDEVSSSSRLS